ncbi:hypothetical protein [Flavobacterium gilvum]|uniref:Uncharacterized protein n=1 Tax=Flavobacterium gilvum TaxID=1492737 RepID=A0AAC9I231_9FLAO|nr:hypothetical protein [Flavobacterium gilvum]AOW08731.1 hypothetical protein EM308_04015 [Flavobacterium gilvum]KFC59830.1 hypothetical protein FEM08_13410 [Flavobacterium gilvum]
MKPFLEAIQTKLATIPALKYIDEDSGQMDSYSPNPPAKFPCALIDITAMNFSNIGKDNTADPINRQTGEGTVTFIIGNMKLSNTSQRAPQSQKDNAWSIWTIIDDLHKAVHGWKPIAESGALMRTSHKRIRRDDGIQEYQITYSVGFANV